MDLEQFNEHWPGYSEGERFADKLALEQLAKEEKALPTGRWLWAAIPIAIGAGKFLNWTEVEILGACGTLALFEIVDLLGRLIKSVHQSRIQFELVKGAIRESRLDSINRHVTLMKIQNRDETGSHL